MLVIARKLPMAWSASVAMSGRLRTDLRLLLSLGEAPLIAGPFREPKTAACVSRVWRDARPGGIIRARSARPRKGGEEPWSRWTTVLKPLKKLTAVLHRFLSWGIHGPARRCWPSYLAVTAALRRRLRRISSIAWHVSFRPIARDGERGLIDFVRRLPRMREAEMSIDWRAVERRYRILAGGPLGLFRAILESYAAGQKKPVVLEKRRCIFATWMKSSAPTPLPASFGSCATAEPASIRCLRWIGPLRTLRGWHANGGVTSALPRWRVRIIQTEYFAYISRT